jgi:hypothetical protein
VIGAIVFVLLALVWLPLTAGCMIAGAACGLWLLDRMIGAPSQDRSSS